MLLHLHVKNLALIEEEEIDFADGLNILTGETGAGKSVIIGSVNLALGERADKGMIRTGAEFALVEMVFSLDNDRQREALERNDIPVEEDGTILIKRKIYPNRSQCTVGGETVTLKQMRELAGLLIDIYGQRENQKLLSPAEQLRVLDSFAGAAAAQKKEETGLLVKKLRKLEEEFAADDLDEAARTREVDLLTYEVEEIEASALREGEDDELEEQYRLLSNFRKISEGIGACLYICRDAEDSVQSLMDRALRETHALQGIDAKLDGILTGLSDAEDVLSNFTRDLGDYIDSLSFDPAEFARIEERLDLINRLKDKYGRTIALIQKSCEEKRKRLEALSDYEETRRKLSAEIEKTRREALAAATGLSAIRKETAEVFAEKLTAELLDLNFNQVAFEARLDTDEERLTQDGIDRVVFMISLNPGEDLRPLADIASGGELSRIMLGMKTAFADKDDIHTFVFDEIDAGISGQTAWKVAQKLGRLGRSHQILCITHLPQIAAQYDRHYRIAKTVVNGRTRTGITPLTDEQSIDELCRLLGGLEMTAAVRENAEDLVKMARQAKKD